MSVETLTVSAAQQLIGEGSDIVVIPYSSYFTADGRVELGIYTEMCVAAAAKLYGQTDGAKPNIIVVGENTLGLNKPSTTELAYEFLADAGIPQQFISAPHPKNANATPQQISWLQKTYGKQWASHPPVMIGMDQHWPRIHELCRLYGLRAEFIGAAALLSKFGELTPRYEQAAQLYDDNYDYEQRAQRLTRIISVLGPQATTAIFRILTAIRTPNIVSVRHNNGKAGFYAATVRQHRRNQRIKT